MPNYIRAFAPGGTFFFTVALLERRQRLLTEHIDELRSVFSAAKQRRPFTIQAIVILPLNWAAAEAIRRMEIE